MTPPKNMVWGYWSTNRTEELTLIVTKIVFHHISPLVCCIQINQTKDFSSSSRPSVFDGSMASYFLWVLFCSRNIFNKGIHQKEAATRLVSMTSWRSHENLEPCGMLFQKPLCLLNPQMNPWAQSKIFSSNETSTKQSSARVQFENILDHYNLQTKISRNIHTSWYK